jgi:hypothetical protein
LAYWTVIKISVLQKKKLGSKNMKRGKSMVVERIREIIIKRVKEIFLVH